MSFEGRLVRGRRDDGWTVEVQFFKGGEPTNEGAIYVFGCVREPDGDYCDRAVAMCAGDMDKAADLIASEYGGWSGYLPSAGYMGRRQA